MKEGFNINKVDNGFYINNIKGKGYTHSETIDITRSDGMTDVKMTTKWTQKGRLFLYDLLKTNNILPDIEKEYSYQTSILGQYFEN